MADLDYGLIMQSITANVRAHAPYRTGYLRSSIRFSVSANAGNEDVFGKLSIDADYSSFVNYGYVTHPNSRKLKRDYLFVEKSIKNSLKNMMYKMGGGYVK